MPHDLSSTVKKVRVINAAMHLRPYFISKQGLFYFSIQKEAMMAQKEQTAVLLLGHGSKRKEANETLNQVAEAVRVKGGFARVLPAFLQLENPDFQEGIDILVKEGYRDILAMPYFLYMGLHVTQDLPNEKEKALKKHPGISISFADNLGFHDKLIDITVQRINESLSKDGRKPVKTFAEEHPIETESFRIIGSELDETPFSPLELPVIKRVIHTTADFEYARLLSFSPGAIQAGINALTAGRDVITDVKMIEAGIRARVGFFGCDVKCFSSDADIMEIAKKEKTTKTAASMRKAAPYLDNSVVVIGNAPTALMELLKLIKEIKASPALVIGVPVGFVGAQEAKDELMASGAEFIATKGRKGGSTVAAAIVNAIAIEAVKTTARA